LSKTMYKHANIVKIYPTLRLPAIIPSVRPRKLENLWAFPLLFNTNRNYLNP